MPNSSIMQASLVILLILSANKINIAEAKSYAGRKIMQKRIDSQSIIYALASYDLSAIKLENIDRCNKNITWRARAST
ncbi:hypothetical protein DITRI_Ditri19aG0046900 [Diplodiscus trichospermus]